MLNRDIPMKEQNNINEANAVLQKEKKAAEQAKKGGAKGKKEPAKPDPKASAQDNTGSKFPKVSAARREVEENPYKKLIDISDLMELETAPEEVQKEIQNVLLRHNSELKMWYRDYSRKIEATKSEESFAMTLKQLWRFLRDCNVVSATSTLAQFDRVFNAGKKNHFSLLGVDDKEKFDFIY